MLKIGDKVKYKANHIKVSLEVLAIESEHVWVKEINKSPSPYTELMSALVLDTIEIGDTVRVINGSGAKYTVIGVHEDTLWVLSSNKIRFNFRVSQVEKV